MASKEVVKVFPGEITSGATLSSNINLFQGWESVALKIPSFASGTDVFLQASESEAGDYVRVTHEAVKTADSDVFDYKINSGLSARIIPIPNGYQHLKIELSTAQTDVTSVFQVICKS